MYIFVVCLCPFPVGNGRHVFSKHENSFGYETELKRFTFPTKDDGYNLCVGDGAYEEYVNSFLKYAELYREYPYPLHSFEKLILVVPFCTYLSITITLYHLLTT